MAADKDGKSAKPDVKGKPAAPQNPAPPDDGKADPGDALKVVDKKSGP